MKFASVYFISNLALLYNSVSPVQANTFLDLNDRFHRQSSFVNLEKRQAQIIGAIVNGIQNKKLYDEMAGDERAKQVMRERDNFEESPAAAAERLKAFLTNIDNERAKLTQPSNARQFVWTVPNVPGVTFQDMIDIFVKSDEYQAQAGVNQIAEKAQGLGEQEKKAIEDAKARKAQEEQAKKNLVIQKEQAAMAAAAGAAEKARQLAELQNRPAKAPREEEAADQEQEAQDEQPARKKRKLNSLGIGSAPAPMMAPNMAPNGWPGMMPQAPMDGYQQGYQIPAQPMAAGYGGYEVMYPPGMQGMPIGYPYPS